MNDIIKRLKVLSAPSDNFEMYTIGIELENGDKYVAYAKSATPPYPPGTEVVISTTGKQDRGTGYPCVSIKKADDGRYSNPPPQGRSTGSQPPPSSISTVHPATVGMAVNRAVDILIAGGYQDDLDDLDDHATWGQRVEAKAKVLIEIALRLETEQPGTQEVDQTKERAAPVDTTDYNQDEQADEDVPF